MLTLVVTYVLTQVAPGDERRAVEVAAGDAGRADHVVGRDERGDPETAAGGRRPGVRATAARPASG